MTKKITAMYFSPTGTTQQIIVDIASRVSQDAGGMVRHIDVTLPEARQTPVSFTDDEVLIIGVPVYAGRVPNILLQYLHSLTGNGAAAVAVVVYGNRHYDDALIELTDILQDRGFKTTAGGAFIGEHSFSRSLAQGRPDAADKAIAGEFGHQVANRLNQPGQDAVSVQGNRPYRAYYKPKNPQGAGVDIRRVTPKTANTCTDCKLCATVCPMGSIDYEQVAILTGICIKCCACVKKCPVQAKYFDDPDYLRHKYELERDFGERREPELFY